MRPTAVGNPPSPPHPPALPLAGSGRPPRQPSSLWPRLGGRLSYLFLSYSYESLKRYLPAELDRGILLLISSPQRHQITPSSRRWRALRRRWRALPCYALVASHRFFFTADCDRLPDRLCTSQQKKKIFFKRDCFTAARI